MEPSSMNIESLSYDGFSVESGHKQARFFHLFFKASALATYLFCTIFSNNFVLVFIFCVLLCCFDFYTVKNITGRLLVGLRWWNEVSEDGTNKWIFESDPRLATQLNPSDSQVFWISLYAYPLIWFILAIGALVPPWHFQWLLVVAVAFSLGMANTLGYYWCSKDAQKMITSFITSKLASRLM